MNPLISVIIPCYNVATYLDAAVDSVLSQTYTNWEMILVDNNSTDGTRTRMEAHAARHPDRIVCLSETRQGVSAARNKGMTIARGQWLQFLDADDVLYPDKLARQVALLTSAEGAGTAVMVVGSYYLERQDGSRTAYRTRPVADPLRFLAFRMLGQTSANLFRHAAVREAGGWAESLPHGGDCDLVFQLLLRNGPEGLCYDQRIGSVYRKREGQLTESAPTERYASIIRMRLNQLQSLQDKTNSGFSSHYLSAYRAAIYDACCTLGVHDRVAADRYFREHLGQQYKPTYLRNGNRTLLHIWLRSGLSFRQYLAVRLWAKAIKRFFT